ncbi:zinc finger domain-containing protein [Streptomyces nodosus]|uniref:zinc finger domain-containing protein n=1 Tax=Streptomyces nodosus TaxID=40318 RepID=UPI0038136D9C
MTPREVAALLAYVVRLDPRMNLDDPQAAADRLAQWCDLLSDVPATAHGWDAARTARDYIARNPYRIQPSDISRPWHAHKADALNRHVGTFEPAQHPHLDPDDVTGYRAALAAERHAVATGQQAPDTHRAITAGPAAAEVERRLAELGTYMPRTVAQALAAHRPRRAEREQLAAANRPDPLDVPCTHPPCRAPIGQPCRNLHRNPRTAHPSRIDAATAHHHARQEQPA